MSNFPENNLNKKLFEIVLIIMQLIKMLLNHLQKP